MWPWADDDFGLKQSEGSARWLSDWLDNVTGFGISAEPVLALPGRYVVPKRVGPVTVVNHKQLCGAIVRGWQDVLNREQVDLITRQLDQRCRDLED
jgi:hypothetical protein